MNTYENQINTEKKNGNKLYKQNQKCIIKNFIINIHNGCFR